MAVTPANIAVDLGRAAPTPGSPTYLQWELWITDAELLIANRRALLPEVTVDPATLDYVVRQAVLAHVKKPDDATQVTIAVDDGSSSRRYESGKGRVTILDEWWDDLGLALDDGKPFTIRPAGQTPNPEVVIW
jgi:hypothetical protein